MWNMLEDIAGFAAAVGVVKKAPRVISNGAKMLLRGLEQAAEYGRLWYHHDFAVRIRGLLFWALLINAAVMGTVIYFHHQVFGTNDHPLMDGYLKFCALAIGPSLWQWFRLRLVRKTNLERVRITREHDEAVEAALLANQPAPNQPK